MAKVIESKKNFKLIECSRTEVAEVFGGAGICDRCNETPGTGVYIAVLNSWYCTKCFEDWHKEAKNYPEDQKVEQSNFDHYKPLFDENTERKNNVIKSMNESLERAKVVLEYYGGMFEKSKNRSDLFIYQVNEVYAMSYENGVAKMGTFPDASVLTENVIVEIEKVAKFSNNKGEKVTPIGAVNAEKFFEERQTEMKDLINQLEQTINALNNGKKN